MRYEEKYVRNFCILAHIDHGKSTLADRFLELTGTIEKRKMREQFLDMHPLERERGITIKMQPVRMLYPFEGNPYILNLIDTPGHVDFTYEVSRALAAVEGAILLVDATQGVQAQTIANLHLAEKEGIIIIPVINKIDLPSADIEKTEEELVELLGVEREEILRVSAKDGTGVKDLLRVVIEKIPLPSGSTAKKIEPAGKKELRALVFDSLYDPYQGVVAHVRIFQGSIKPREKIYFVASRAESEVLEVGVFLPERKLSLELYEGEIGYISTGIKEPELVRVGDTITHLGESVSPLVGYHEPEPVVFASVFPENQDEYEVFREALKKLKLNDAAFTFTPEATGSVLGRGFRVGFLGMLHMEIVSERLRREYGLHPIFSNPSVAFKIKTKRGAEEMVYSAFSLPEQYEIDGIEEPWIELEVITPSQFLGPFTSLINEREGKITSTQSLGRNRLLIFAQAPLRQIIVDFHDVLKSVTQGFASMAYHAIGYRQGDLVRLDILVAGERILAFSEIVPRGEVQRLARIRVEKLKELLPRELFSVALQAESGGRIIARETISAMRKDVTGYLYGGDRSRKMKLWKKQQKGKKKLKEMGKVEIPADVFLKMLKK